MISLFSRVVKISCAVVAFLHPQRSLSVLPASLSLSLRHTDIHTKRINTIFRHQTELIHKANTGHIYQIRRKWCIIKCPYLKKKKHSQTHRKITLLHCSVSQKHISNPTPTKELHEPCHELRNMIKLNHKGWSELLTRQDNVLLVSDKTKINTTSTDSLAQPVFQVLKSINKATFGR